MLSIVCGGEGLNSVNRTLIVPTFRGRVGKLARKSGLYPAFSSVESGSDGRCLALALSALDALLLEGIRESGVLACVFLFLKFGDGVTCLYLGMSSSPSKGGIS